MGKTLAEGWSEPVLQKAGFGLGRTRAVYQARFFSSSITLWVSVLLSQIGSSPHHGEGPIWLVRDEGVAGSRTGCSTSLAVAVFGSRIGISSVESSGEP